MNYRERIRKAIACPQFGDKAYGEWGALNLEQRQYIKRLLDELDSADNYLKRVYLENKQLKDNWNKIEQIIENERMSHWAPSPLFLTELLSKMEKLEKGDSNE